MGTISRDHNEERNLPITANPHYGSKGHSNIVNSHFTTTLGAIWRREISWQSRNHKAQSTKRKKTTSDHTNTEPCFHAALSRFS